MRSWGVATRGVVVWTAAGFVLAAVLRLPLGSWSNCLALSGLVLAIGAVAWVVGPAKAPMAWSEGALMAYHGNDDTPSRAIERKRRLLSIAVPLFPLVAGVLLLAGAGVAAAL